MEEMTWLMDRRRKATNAHCDLEFAGPRIMELSGSFVSLLDVGVKCTSLLADIFSLILHDMHVEGVLKELQDTFLALPQLNDATCPTVEMEDEAQISLTLKDMSGIFVLHYLASAMCLMWHYYRKYFPAKEKKVSPEDSAQSDDGTESEDTWIAVKQEVSPTDGDFDARLRRIEERLQMQNSVDKRS